MAGAAGLRHQYSERQRPESAPPLRLIEQPRSGSVAADSRRGSGCEGEELARDTSWDSIASPSLGVVEVLLPVTNNLLDMCRVADSQRAERLLTRDPTQVLERTPIGNTALHVVSQARQDDPDFDASVATIKVLLKYGADPKVLNGAGKTPAQWYRQLGMDEVADFMADRDNDDR